MKKIYQSDKTLTFANKSSNMYRLTKEEYVKMRKNAITSTCTPPPFPPQKKQKNKKTISNIKKRTDIKGKQIMENVEKEMLDRMDINSNNTCFITLQDH